MKFNSWNFLTIFVQCVFQALYKFYPILYKVNISHLGMDDEHYLSSLSKGYQEAVKKIKEKIKNMTIESEKFSY